MEENQFDVVVLGTGLVESITAAALSKAGYKVAHIDSNPYYGGEEASLSLEELAQWADSTSNSSTSSRFHHISRSVDIPTQSRQYAICLRPSVIPSVGPFISSLIMSGVAKYSGFRLLGSFSVYESSGRMKNVPGSKEDIFKSKDISLIEKRRLMRFLTFAAGDFSGKKELEGKHDMPFIQFLQSTFSLSEETSGVIAYSLAFCMSSSEPTLFTLQRLQRYLRSAGRYGPSPFLIGHYGGIGDIAQGFCRASAVNGGVYILARKVTKISRAKFVLPHHDSDVPTTEHDVQPIFTYDLTLADFPETLSCKLIISSTSYIPSDFGDEVLQLSSSSQASRLNIASIARCIAVIDEPLTFQSPAPGSSDQGVEAQFNASLSADTRSIVDTAVLVFPPSSVAGGSTTHSSTIFVNGEGSLSTPKGKWLIYIGLPLGTQQDAFIPPEALLTPYLNAVMRLSTDPSKAPIKPIFTIFYLESPTPPVPGSHSENHTAPNTYLVPPPLPTASLPDVGDESALIAETTFLEAVKVLRKIGGHAEEAVDDIPFWPPLPADEDNDDDEW
ncbi:GDP dissociation inhibitor-domain-containing protein [Gymnopilus junonius]|uniref:GDP dissociation inhibitor-domain-containing protein n=1 Tax=Gymnopilus junonius TaxID=109634 RepID=A0A9P5NZV9_GYMJU|nr:GDP dissociation inhibitor-domain-containing protein [Gymnopilus junonius]